MAENMEMKWYVASTQSGQENTVVHNIRRRLESSDKADTVAHH